MRFYQYLLIGLISIVLGVSLFHPGNLKAEEASASIDEEDTTEIFYYSRETNRFERKPNYERYHYHIDGLKINVGYDEELYPTRDYWSQGVTQYLYGPPY